MKPPKIFYHSMSILGTTILFQVYLIYKWYAYVATISDTDIQISPYVFLLEWFWLTLFIIDFIIYWKIRLRIFNRSWLLIHVFSLFTAIVVLTLLNKLSWYLFPFTFDNSHWNNEFHNYFGRIMIISYWCLLSFGHIFFIATIVKSFSPKKETIEDEPTPGLLDEFAKWCQRLR